MARTFLSAKKDKRVYSIEKISGEDFDEDGYLYEINLNDGWMFDDGSHINYASSVKELWEMLDEVKEESEV